jgi:hypothetical protein
MEEGVDQLRTREGQETVGRRRASRDSIAHQLLTVSGVLSLGVAVFQAVVCFSPSWSRSFGAPSELVSDPTLLRVAGLAASVLFGAFGLYAFSGAGRVRPLPFLRLGLLAIGCLYTLRGLMVVPVVLVLTGTLEPSDDMPEQSMALASSLVSLLIGVVHLVGLLFGWRDMQGARLRQRGSP